MAEAEKQIVEFAIAKLRLEPGDILVVKCQNMIYDQESWNTAQAYFAECGVKSPILIIGDDVDLSILTQAQVKALAA